MGDSNVYIRDHLSLVALNNTLGYGADSILKLLESVNSYLDGVLDVLDKQVKCLADELKKAEQALSAAEEELRSCEASQEWDEEEHEYRPSCSSESRSVARARRVCDECRRKYDEGRRIKDECDKEIESYRDPGLYFKPPGGERTLEYLAVEHTEDATKKMQEILDIVEGYTRTPVSVGNISGYRVTPVVPNGNRPVEDRPLGDAEKKKRFENAVRNVIERQQDRNYGDRKIADANRAMKCPQCDRPIAACICDMDARLKDNIKIIDDGLSR